MRRPPRVAGHTWPTSCWSFNRRKPRSIPQYRPRQNGSGIGLHTMWRGDKGEFRFRQVLEAQPWVKEPELKNVDELLKANLQGRHQHRPSPTKYREAIHR